jgi:hypothetical protein
VPVEQNRFSVGEVLGIRHYGLCRKRYTVSSGSETDWSYLVPRRRETDLALRLAIRGLSLEGRLL